MGIARLALAGLAVLVAVALIVVGAFSLVGALNPDPGPAAPSTPAAAPSVPSATPEQIPTVRVQCLQEHCPKVFLKVAGGDVLLDREMARDEQAQSFDAKVDVVLADSAAVRVEVNGEVRPPGKAGERQEFTASRD
ncbi:hypothetical protein [Streptosporangium roseum]|uniref:DUF4115 domain-containing protein n=1 Tax=Streptosporangium roseum (strain ATCC 12428 / DSM 43021 / JCM 3005 / KCTC 9067 / NCIMB 10171 / NRRL 2505 / NI 9100) TaxID=479432 RepID=D2B117_STRRD|nr:hypothetical protein [Streptosporangium roseum]ACZ83424.1 hypothetical protein Sros_0393 [Streptosporangium roseum DSM 43021]